MMNYLVCMEIMFSVGNAGKNNDGKLQDNNKCSKNNDDLYHNKIPVCLMRYIFVKLWIL